MVCGFSASCREDVTTRVQVALRTCLLKLGTVTQGRAEHGRRNRRAQAGLPRLTGKAEDRGSAGDELLLLHRCPGCKSLRVQETCPWGKKRKGRESACTLNPLS